MPTQLQLEGPDLEVLLARVRTEHGSAARIVQAEKVRTGGVGGFFAKQSFAITIEVDGVEPSVAGALPRVPTSLLDLADEVSAAERTTAATASTATGSTATASTATVSTESTGFAAVLASLGTAAGGSSAARVATATGASAAAGAAQQRAAASPVPRRRASDVYDAYEEGEAGHVAPARRPAVPAQRRASSPTTTRPARRSPAAPTPAASPPAAPRSAAVARRAPATVAPRTGAQVVARPRVGGRGSGVVTVAAPGALATRTPAAVAVRGKRSAATPTATTAVVRVSRATAPRSSSPRSTDPRASGPRATGALQAVAPARPTADVALVDQLAELGLPAHLQPASADAGVYPALVESLRALPKAPRAVNRPGKVLAVVGPMPLALDVARQIARELELPARTAVLLATGARSLTDLPDAQVLRDPEDALERRTWLRRRRTTTIIAVDAPLTAAGAAQARSYLEALEPSSTWGVVEATRKARDVGAWTRAVGGVGALALTAVDETADPAAVLELGIPVGRLGSRPATPAAWAALLADRVAA